VDRDWLTVGLVEQLQERIEDGHGIASILANLRGATLPGLMEYGCLRNSLGISLGALPSAIVFSTIGKSLSAVPSALGLRKDGTAYSRSRTIEARPAEFCVVRDENELCEENWEIFTIRFARSARSVGLTKTVSDGMRGALHEMAENAVIHSRSDVPGRLRGVGSGKRFSRGNRQIVRKDWSSQRETSRLLPRKLRSRLGPRRIDLLQPNRPDILVESTPGASRRKPQ
jgi:hypothetical protein